MFLLRPAQLAAEEKSGHSLHREGGGKDGKREKMQRKRRGNQLREERKKRIQKIKREMA